LLLSVKLNLTIAACLYLPRAFVQGGELKLSLVGLSPEEVIERVAANKEVLNDLLPLLPEDVYNYLTGPAFETQCQIKFDEVRYIALTWIKLLLPGQSIRLSEMAITFFLQVLVINISFPFYSTFPSIPIADISPLCISHTPSLPV